MQNPHELSHQWSSMTDAGFPPSSLRVGDHLMVRVTCEPCHRAKTACDGTQPCGRCSRLQRIQQCVPYQRKRVRQNSQTGKPASTSEVPATDSISQSREQMQIARLQLAASFGSNVATRSTEATLQSAPDTTLFHRSLSYETSTFNGNMNSFYPIGHAAATQESMFSPPTLRDESSSAAFWEPPTPTDFFFQSKTVEHGLASRLDVPPTPIDHDRAERQQEVVAIPIANVAATTQQPLPDSTSQSQQLASRETPTTAATVSSPKSQGWDTEGVLRDPPAWNPSIFAPLQTEGFQALLRRQLTSGRSSSSAFAYRLSGMSEFLCLEDWKRLVLLMPIPVPPCSMRASFAAKPEFRDWWVEQRLRAAAALGIRQDKSGVSSSTSSTSSTSPIHRSPIQSDNNSPPEILASHLCFLPMLMELDFTDSPMLCVEEEQMLAGLLPRLVLMQQPSATQPLQPTMVIRASKQGRSSSSSSTGGTSNGDLKSKSRRRESSYRKHDHADKRRRSRSSSSSSRSISSASRSRSRSASPSSSSRSTSRRRRRNDRSRSRSRSRSRNQSSSSKSSYRAGPPTSETDVFRRELQTRMAGFDSTKPASAFDTLRTKHTTKCIEGKTGRGSELLVSEALAAVSATERDSQTPESVSLDRSDVNDKAVRSAIIGLAPCGCPCVIRRRMHIQVNRAYETIVGWTQREIRDRLIRYGKAGLMQIMNGLMGGVRDPSIEIYSLFTMLNGETDFRVPVPVSLSNRWGGRVQAQMSVKIVAADNEIDGYINTWTVDPLQSSKDAPTEKDNKPNSSTK